jgi:epidermal growth factor receptor substrate 15
MKRWMTSLAVCLAALAATAGTALGAGPVQSGTQSSSTDQAALAASSATQVQPTNENISVRVLSPGNDGAVSQSNEAESSANAANTASTTQNATQGLASSCGCAIPGTRSSAVDGVLAGALQAAGDGTPAAAPAAAPAPTGSAQANDAASTGTAANTAPTSETATQSSSGGGSGVQSTQQDASTQQAALAASSATQDHPENSNISVRVLSPGNDGAVRQSNEASSSADAKNTAATTQGSSQTGSGSGVQSSTQNADTSQESAALSSAKQVHPENSNVSVRILSPGDGGSVSQKNEAESSANAQNSAPVTQTSTQSGSGISCGCESKSPAVQAIGQSSSVEQAALAASSANQFGASNSNEPIRIGSYGNDGSVSQKNEAESSASATNTAPVTQIGTQTQLGSRCGCSAGPAVQAIGQSSETEQLAVGLSSATQIGASNENGPIRIASPGNDGRVSQENSAESSASATNTAPVTQTGAQTQTGSSCGCSGPAVQAIGQSSEIGQLAVGLSSAKQVGASNENGPIRIASWGNGGSVSQENEAESSASASNNAPTTQTESQTQSGSGVQALGQDSSIWQGALAASSATQLPGESKCGCRGASFGNASDPVRIGSYGNDGYLKQENEASSSADATNYAAPTQSGTQTQSSGCSCHGLGVQALGQWSSVHQGAAALSSATQVGAKNSSAPVRIWSPVGGGWTWQSNEAESSAYGSNVARILQAGQQVMV